MTTDSPTPIIVDMDAATLSLPCELCGAPVEMDVLEFDMDEAQICTGCIAEAEGLRF